VLSRIRFYLLVLTGLLVLPALSGRNISESDRQHWAFQPLRRIEIPKAAFVNVQSPIDRFILARLQTNHLGLSPRATREQLIRRVSFDLIGLPPTIQEVDAFLRDKTPQAYPKLIDRLLASPHYGERWGRHWLDLARFAESDGFEHDAARPYAWRYRDYVVRSFNQDKPYDQFIREQIAGDELFPNNPDALIATGFNLLGPDMVDSADQTQRRHNTLNDMTDTTALVFLGQTLGCARCHNHKSEPFSQRDYYQLQAFFTPAKFEREVPVPSPTELAAHRSQTAKYEALTQLQREQIESIEAPYREQLYAAKLAKLSEEARLAHETPKEKRTVEMQNLVLETADQLKISESELLKKMSAEEKARHSQRLDELKKFPKPPSLPLAMGLRDAGAPAKTFVLSRGDYNNPGDEVQPAFPEILQPNSPEPVANIPGETSQTILPLPKGEGRGEGKSDVRSRNRAISDPESALSRTSRSTLANWIASPENPLTARIMVNRVWQHHFGRGIAPSPSEFGTRAEPPTHPELLDWLAQEFIASGWSLKKLHKLILLSEAYQRSSLASPEALARDPDNKLFSRQNRVRLEGEVIRDSLLAISGQLNPKLGGPGVFPPIPADMAKGLNNWTVSAAASDRSRRSLYIFARRNLRYPFLEVFDAPDNNLSCPQRGRSTTAPQSLTLLNSEEVMAAAKAAATRVTAEAGADPVAHAFRLILGSPPTPAELKLANNFLQSSPRDQALEELCRALFNINRFVYVD
jgi:hypothetical protein